MYKAHTEASRDCLATIRASVVGDYDLADDAVLAQRPLCLTDAGFQRVCLIQARHDDGDLDCVVSFV
jgi:hypothetical protein